MNLSEIVHVGGGSNKQNSRKISQIDPKVDIRWHNKSTSSGSFCMLVCLMQTVDLDLKTSNLWRLHLWTDASTPEDIPASEPFATLDVFAMTVVM